MIAPADVLFGAPDLLAVVPSPDGARIAFLRPVDGTLRLWVGSDLATAEPLAPVGLTPASGPTWLGEDRLVWLQDSGGDENFHLHTVELSTGRATDLTPYDGVQAKLLGVSSRRPDQVAVALNRDDPTQHRSYLVDVRAGELEELPGGTALRHLVDADLTPRVLFRPRADGSVEVVTDGATVAEVGSADLVTLVLGRQELRHDGKVAYCLSSAATDTVALVALDTASGERWVLHHDPDFDVGDFSVSPRDGVADLVCVDADRRRWTALDPDVQSTLDLLTSLPGDVRSIARSQDDRTWVVCLVRDDAPTCYVRVDRDTGRSELVGSERVALEDYDLGTTEPFSFTSRDGLTVHGYVTRPPGAGSDPLPAVLWVHGGPWSRDRWGYDPFVQLFATRGYACVQVNFRGSSGYGTAFLDAGDREWGAAMQRDLEDAVDALAARGVVDPARLAIAGGSYGGYATLMGLATTPERYRCGIALVAPSDLVTLLESFPPYWAGLLAHWHARVGHPVEDIALLRERSPLTHAARITAPLLLVHGANDPRVKQAESDALAAALRARGGTVDYHVLADEGHGVSQPHNSVWLLNAMADFLGEHLPVGP